MPVINVGFGWKRLKIGEILRIDFQNRKWKVGWSFKIDLKYAPMIV